MSKHAFLRILQSGQGRVAAAYCAGELGLLLPDNTAPDLLDPYVLGSVLTAAKKKTKNLPPLFMGSWPRRAVIVLITLKNWLVIV